jgi:hypothetical protein
VTGWNAASQRPTRLPIATLQRLSAQEPVQRRDRVAAPRRRMRSKAASRKAASRRVPSSVATSALDSWAVSEAWMGLPLRKAPPPRTACKGQHGAG